MQQLKIHNFIKPELDKFKELCNFTEEELKYFELKSKRCSDVFISNEMHISISKVALLSKQVRCKIRKVL